ncbi:hypothetical protein [Streptomyces cacaoi]|uniref:Restriction endonuclease n=1 Tax=Streptomyces cacaoi TaxID=1898 RepID=A0A4Y3R567_STRCI|nr:hypothetical protein [Streptomyces cacaoi]NNG84528.1 hypothetical protein [Streptomyces cacaoi]GEB52694.1 hypothetical protein SCA03_52450 [Streptomyces cacaoi]
MVYVITLTDADQEELRGKLTGPQAFTWNIPGRTRRTFENSDPNLAFIFVADEGWKPSSKDGKYREKVSLRWIGATLTPLHQKSTSLDYRAHIKLVRPVTRPVTLADMSAVLRRHEGDHLEAAVTEYPGVHQLGVDLKNAAIGALNYLRPELQELLQFLEVAVDADTLDSDAPEDQAWREERDAMRTILRIGQFPTALAGVWRRPRDRHDPYLAGLMRDPTEASLMEHDTRFFGDWMAGDRPQRRCDIQVFTDGRRRLEVANVNATRVEGRLGTDLIYYHHGTHSFTLVQYKKLGPRKNPLYVGPNDRLHSQLDRLDVVSGISLTPEAARDWRLSSDHCFIKLAHWAEDDFAGDGAPTSGMILPVPYVRLLLQDPATATSGRGRLLGYQQVERYLTNTQFIQLVQDGFVGSVGVDIETLRDIVDERVEQGNGVMLAAEDSRETPAERRRRNHSRGA